MPRNGSNVYSLPANTAAVSGQTISSSKWNTLTQDLETDMNTPRPVVAGGTGASGASGARTNLGLVIGTDVQAYNALLAAIAGLSAADGQFIVGNGSTFVAETGATARASMGAIADIVEDITPQLGGPLDANSQQIRASAGANVASAATLTLGNDGNSFIITGTTNITAIATKAVGTIVTLRFNGVLTLTHHATDLILPQGRDIVTAAGAVATFREYATGDWELLSYLDPDVPGNPEEFIVDFQEFPSGGTWNKPSAAQTGDIFRCQVIGAGGSGARDSGTTGNEAGGGGGGGGIIFEHPEIDDLPASATVTTGAGGAGLSTNANGNAGGQSRFNATGFDIIANGGGGGLQNDGNGGAGGSVTVNGAGWRTATQSGTFSDDPWEGGDGGDGGGGGAQDGGNSFYGAGGGGSSGSSNTGGRSAHAGFGGDGNSSGPGEAGVFPGGGAGGGTSGTNGDGADGIVRVWIIRRAA